MPDLDYHLRKGAAMLRGEAVEVTMDDVVDLMQLTQPQLFVDTSFGPYMGWGPPTPYHGRTVHWPDGTVTLTAPPRA